jgi:hypothetical protein
MMLAEMRSLRESIVIADQLPTAVAAEVVKNTNLKIAHRLVSADDRKDIGQAMLLDSAQMEEIARLNPGESFVYMEGWYRPHLIKIDRDNNAKAKLNIESSINTPKIISLLRTKPWYRQAQSSLLVSTEAEFDRLITAYHQTFTNFRRQTTAITTVGKSLESELGNLTTEIFCRLSSLLAININPALLNRFQIDNAIRSINTTQSQSLNNLQPIANLELTRILDLQTQLFDRLDAFTTIHQQICLQNQKISRQNYQQQWQHLDRQIHSLEQQSQQICSHLQQTPNSQQKERHHEIQYQQRLIVQEETALTDFLQSIAVQSQELRAKVGEVLNQAILTAQVDLVVSSQQNPTGKELK